MKIKQIMSVFGVMLMVLVLSSCVGTRRLDKTGTVCFEQKCIDVEVATKFEDRTIGLQFRGSLGKNSGMLFVFPESSYKGFWMKDTYISLDIIWLNKKKEIVYIKRRVLPCEKSPCKIYKSTKPAKYVLEINSGHADRLGLAVGDVAVFDY